MPAAFEFLFAVDQDECFFFFDELVGFLAGVFEELDFDALTLLFEVECDFPACATACDDLLLDFFLEDETCVRRCLRSGRFQFSARSARNDAGITIGPSP